MPFISVLIAAYNTAKYLEQCLDSVQRQYFTDFEWLIGIDGDNEIKLLIDKIRNKYPTLKIFWAKEHQGHGAIINTLAYKATGTYLTMFESDDIMLPNYLNIVRLYCESGCLTRSRCIEFTTEPNVTIPKRETWGGIWTISKGDFITLGGYANWVNGEDDEFYTRIAKSNFKIFQHPFPSYYKRYRLDSMSNCDKFKLGSKGHKELLERIAKVERGRINPVFAKCEEI